MCCCVQWPAQRSRFRLSAPRGQTGSFHGVASATVWPGIGVNRQPGSEHGPSHVEPFAEAYTLWSHHLFHPLRKSPGQVMGLQADDDDSSDIRATARSFLAIVLTRPTTTSERPPRASWRSSDRVANAPTTTTGRTWAPVLLQSDSILRLHLGYGAITEYGILLEY